MRAVVTKLNPNTSSEADTKTVQMLDTYGNLTWSQVYDYGNLSTPARTYNNYYLTGSNYTSRNIYNRLTSATVTPAAGSAITVVTNSYDYPPPQATQATLMHDPTYGTSFLYRGNVGQTTGIIAIRKIDLREESYAGLVCSGFCPLFRRDAVRVNSRRR